jgi:2-polyprenyl-6-hydroxyphenyl methylase/3-demethylubiquinone-9 3-methyltransferase
MEQPKTWKWQLAQQLEYRWWQRYLRNKQTADYLPWKLAYWNKLLATVAPHMPQENNLSILDAGCGPAGIFMALDGNRVEAIDPLLDKYADLPHFIPTDYPWVNFTTLSLEALDKTDHYDRIFCLNAINHVNDLSTCYNNLIQALKPGGYLVVSTDAHRHRLLKKIFQLIPGDMLHPVQLDINEYESLLTDRSMQIIQHILYKREAIFDYYITVARKTAVRH